MSEVADCQKFHQHIAASNSRRNPKALKSKFCKRSSRHSHGCGNDIGARELLSAWRGQAARFCVCQKPQCEVVHNHIHYWHTTCGGSKYISTARGWECAEISPEFSKDRKTVCAPSCALLLKERSYGGAALQGTGRTNMEDTYSIVVDPNGKEPAFFGVYDGHGGNAVAEMLKTSVWPIYKKKLSDSDLVRATTAAYLEIDQITLAQPKGLFGAMRERGLGGSKCGSTAATAVLLPESDGKKVLVAANVGDARVVVVRNGQAVQLTVDHKPDVEEERKRIEARNPTPKKPLVVNVGGTWRVGGLLALSRAFGDVYLKSWSDNKAEGARGGFGLTAEPHVTVEILTPEDQMIILGTDGLWELGNQEVVDICLTAEENTTPEEIMKKLIRVAQDKGVTDDVAGILVRL